MRSKMLFLTVTAAVVLSLAVSGHAAPKYTMKFANVVSKDHSWGRAAEMFKTYLEEATGGQIDLQVHHAAALGSNREVLEALKMGVIEFMNTGVGHVTNHVPELGVLVLPYLWKDTETMFEALDGPFGGAMGGLLSQKGFELMGWWDNGFRHVSNNAKPILSVADMKGLKIRCLPAKVHVSFFKALGASPTPMGWAELYQALQQGVVDGQENPPAMVYFGKIQEVQKYYSLSAHLNEPGCILMSKKTLEKLPADLQLAVKVAAQKATLWQRKENEKDNAEFLEKLKSGGMKINDVPKENIAEFRKIAQSVYPEAIQEFGPKGKELVDVMVFFNK